METLSQWIKGALRREHLSLRQAGAKTGLSHATIGDIRKGVRPDPETIMKLARAFGGDGAQGLALEDHLLTLAGYRTPRQEGEELSVAYATLMDRVSKFSDPQLEMMCHFADFLIEVAKEGGASQ